MAMLNNGQLPTNPNEIVNSSPKVQKIGYASYFLGNCYDPEEHIYFNSDKLEQDYYKFVAADDDFALYLDFPLYKEIHAPKGYAILDTVTKKRYDCRTLRLSKTIFDMSTTSNYKKLKTYIKNKLEEPNRLFIVKCVASASDILEDSNDVQQ